MGFPRHLSQHVGGFVITRDRLDEIVPIENAAMEERTMVEWDKDDLDALGILKVDVLALGMLSCLRRALDLLADSITAVDRSTLRPSGRGGRGLRDDPARRHASASSRSKAARRCRCCRGCKPKEFYDLVIEVAIVRPGPIQGDMVHPYLRRRQGLEESVLPASGA